MIEIPKSVVMPFSDIFSNQWILWKAYMLESHQFNYRGVISEQMALKRVVELSEGEEEKAIRIVHQSISREWKDFFELRQPSINGKSKQKKQSASSSRDTEQVRSEIRTKLNQRFGGGEQAADESHSKAV